MATKKLINAFAPRSDDYKSKKIKDNPIVTEYKRRFKLKPVAETGEYVEEAEIYKFDEYDLYERIQAEAIGTTLYEILDRVLMNPQAFADNGKGGADLSMISPNDSVIDVQQKINNIDLTKLDASLQGINPATLAQMSDEEILNYVKNFNNKNSEVKDNGNE